MSQVDCQHCFIHRFLIHTFLLMATKSQDFFCLLSTLTEFGLAKHPWPLLRSAFAKPIPHLCNFLSPKYKLFIFIPCKCHPLSFLTCISILILKSFWYPVYLTQLSPWPLQWLCDMPLLPSNYASISTMASILEIPFLTPHRKLRVDSQTYSLSFQDGLVNQSWVDLDLANESWCFLSHPWSAWYMDKW